VLGRFFHGDGLPPIQRPLIGIKAFADGDRNPASRRIGMKTFVAANIGLLPLMAFWALPM
jgi:hypothetical protein